MMSVRQAPPMRPRRPSRPTWLVALLVAVGVLVVLGLGYGVISLVRGDDPPSPAAESAPTPSPCATVEVPVRDTLPKPAKVTVNVYNATGTSGLASKTASALEGRGFAVGKVDNDPVGQPIDGVARIRFGPKAADDAQLLLAYVPGAQLVPLDRKGTRVDLAMGDAFTGLAPKEEVEATLTRPTPIASGPGCPATP